MKKTFLVLLSVLVLSVCGCGSDDSQIKIKGVVATAKTYQGTAFTNSSTNVKFKDGRTMRFQGIYDAFQKGECYIITYNEWNNKIIRVEECNSTK